MKVHFKIPFSLDKNLGAAYNEAMRDIPDNDWCCLLDYDVCFLTHETITDIYEYINRFADAGILTCKTNRIGNSQQLYSQAPNTTDIKKHIFQSTLMRENLYAVRQLSEPISGFLMCLSKKTWNEYKFRENRKCLGVDNEYSEQILKAGKDVLLMEGVYVWHSYRLIHGKNNKDHLL